MKQEFNKRGWNEEELTDYRYIGANPNNYVTFNGEEAGWRIVGIFTVENEKGEKEKRIKLIHSFNEYIKGIAWAWNEYDSNDEFSAYWGRASLMKILNPDTGETEYNWTEEGKQMIGDTKWYLGSGMFAFSLPEQTNQHYKAERIQKDDFGDSLEEYYGDVPYWIGKVGLIYPSDYGYATSDSDCVEKMNLYYYNKDSCYRNDWMYLGDDFQQLTITPLNNDAVYIQIAGGAMMDQFYDDVSSTDESIKALPSVYLVSDVQYLKGNGSKEEPFVFTK